MWPTQQLCDLVGVDVPIVQAPMAGASGAALAIAVSQAGGLGSLPCAMLSPQRARDEISLIGESTPGPFNVNFFCHQATAADEFRQTRWRARLQSYYDEMGLDLPATDGVPGRGPFGPQMCEVVEDTRPRVVSFHFGLPGKALLSRVKAAGALVFSSATTVAEAQWLEANGCDVIIAQGYEAGGHRGMFLSESIDNQPGTLALVPQVVDAVKVPVVAAGGISDARGIAAAFALGAVGVQMGTAYLLTPESLISDLHREALRAAADDATALTNVFSGRPARGVFNRIMREIGPMSDQVPPFPSAGAALAPLKSAAEAMGRTDFTSMWSGQAAALAKEIPAGDLTRQLADEARQLCRALASTPPT
jgi:nitronate monooxygenase